MKIALFYFKIGKRGKIFAKDVMKIAAVQMSVILKNVMIWI